jgi:hypothetical protein
MRIGSEAPKRRTHSSIRLEAKGHLGIPPPRTVIGVPSRAGKAETVGVPSASAPVSSVEVRQCVGKESAACMVPVVALQQESKTAITGTEPDLMRQSPCFDGSIIGVACLRPCRNS